MPNAVNSPNLNKAGDLNTGALIGVFGSGSFDLQTAIAVTDKAGMLFDAMFYSMPGMEGETVNSSIWEIGCGAFKERNEKKDVVLQCYGGLGYGSTEVEFSDESRKDEGGYLNFFVQPGVVIKGKSIDSNVDLRLNYVNYIYADPGIFVDYSGETSTDFLLFEPVLTVRFGKKKLKGMLQGGLCLPLINTVSYLNVSNVITFVKLSAGISYTFQTK